jgi:5-methyltetrahydrofolate--homocysteine methyltransferase
MMCEGAGFQIVDIGFNADPEKFIEAIKEHQPDVVGMSAMLTTTMRAMAHTIKAIEVRTSQLFDDARFESESSTQVLI